MCLITDHQVKVATCKDLPLIVICCIDTVYHGLICGKYTMCRIVIFLFDYISAGQIREHIDKAPLRLSDK